MDKHSDGYQEEAPIFEHDTEVTFGKRSVKAIFLTILVIFFIGVLGTFLMMQDRVKEEAEAIVQQAQTAPASGQVQRSGINQNGQAEDGFFASLYDEWIADSAAPFAGEEKPFENAYGMKDNSQGFVDGAVQYKLDMLGQQQKLAQASRGYDESLFEIIGAEVEDSQGKRTGDIYDIIVERHTGEAQALIINDEETRTQHDLHNLDFENISAQSESGHVRLELKEEQVENKPLFDYQNDLNSQYISLRRLRAGQVQDDRGVLVGQIDAVRYQNAQAQGVIIDLKPALDDSKRHFYIPFSEVNINESEGGLDIKLTTEQTRALADMLFAKKDEKARGANNDQENK